MLLLCIRDLIYTNFWCEIGHLYTTVILISLHILIFEDLVVRISGNGREG